MKTSTDKFVEAIRYLDVGADTAGEEAAIRQVVEAFADAAWLDKQERATLLRRVVGEDDDFDR